MPSAKSCQPMGAASKSSKSLNWGDPLGYQHGTTPPDWLSDDSQSLHEMSRTDSSPVIEVRDLAFAYNNPQTGGQSTGETDLILKGVSLTVDQGEFVSVIGPSGSGKSTLLLLLDGLVAPVSGTILIHGQRVSGPQWAHCSMVFQDAALLPWRTILHNVKLGLELQHKGDNRTIRDRALGLIELVGLEGRENYYPYQLSGGMRQRVGLARALAVEPLVLLMDEPFGALDAQTRESMGNELLRIWQTRDVSVVFVTHDIDEAIFLSDRVLVLGGQPADVIEDLQIEMTRPRDIEIKDTAKFIEYRKHLRNLIAGGERY
jgi:NitT/TauT family transport system ATP-binding protein